MPTDRPRERKRRKRGLREVKIKEGLRSCTVSVAVLRKCTVVHYLARPVLVLYTKEHDWLKTAAFKEAVG